MLEKTAETTLHKILIVDDEEIVLVSLRDTLAREGYEVATALNAPEALAQLKSFVYSVVITDQQMPMLTGLEFLSQVKQMQPNATRILITGVLNLSTVIEAINKGEIYRFMVKPWLREELLVTVKNAAQRYELLCNNQLLQLGTLAMNDKLSNLNRELEHQVARVADQNLQLERLNSALRENLAHSVELCFRTMQTFYPTLGIQARCVFELCHTMAKSLHLTPEERQTLEVSAWLHDIGLVGIPRQLIKRWEETPANVNPAEKALIQEHPVFGEELTCFAHPLANVGAVIRAHHERYDGKGYPDQLAGEAIPWLGRLLGLAVAYAETDGDSRSSINMIKEGCGSAFDPEAVHAFLCCLPQVTVPIRGREVLLSELQPGMVLARSIYTANGLLLMPDGQRLNEAFIEKLNHHNRVFRISESLLIYS